MTFEKTLEYFLIATYELVCLCIPRAIIPNAPDPIIFNAL